LKLLRDILPEPLDHQDYQKFSRKNNPDKSESHASLVKNPQLDNSKISPLQSDETDKIT
jgi:hypothetical protein